MTKNIPNILTVSRMALTPVFAVLALRGLLVHGVAVFAVAMLSDVADGAVAKRYESRTELGALLDPLADKMLLTTSFIVLWVIGLVPLWLALLVATRDCLMLSSIAALWFYRKKTLFAPNVFGRLTTVLQTLTILLALFIGYTGGRAAVAAFTPLAVVTALVTTVSGLSYAWREVQARR